MAQRMIIQVDMPDRPSPTLSDVRQLLEGTGIELDPSYGPIPINPALGRYVVRGSGTDAAKRRALEIPGIKVFADTAQGPI